MPDAIGGGPRLPGELLRTSPWFQTPILEGILASSAGRWPWSSATAGHERCFGCSSLVVLLGRSLDSRMCYVVGSCASGWVGLNHLERLAGRRT